MQETDYIINDNIPVTQITQIQVPQHKFICESDTRQVCIKNREVGIPLQFTVGGVAE